MLLSCGSNSFSHLALGHDSDTSTLTPTIETPIGEIVNLVSSSAHSLLLVRNAGRNTLYGIGTNTVGQLGRQCALRDEDDVQVLRTRRRLNLIAELEDGLRESEEDWEPVLIGAMWTSSIVVYRRTGSSGQSVETNGGGYMILTCGSNDFNELGHNEISSSSTVSITRASPCPRVVDIGLGPGDKVEKLSCGQRHVMLVVADTGGKQRVVGWGAGRRGEFDLSTLGGSSDPAGDDRKGKGKGKGKAAVRPTTYPPTTTYLPLDTGADERIVDISLGASHTLVLTSKKRVFAWGSNQKGQLTATSFDPPQADLKEITQIAASWGGSYFLNSSGAILSQGSNTYSQLLHPESGRAAVRFHSTSTAEGWEVEEMVTGSEHLLVIMKRGDQTGLWVGGWNEHGNLGLGDQKDRAGLVRLNGLPEGRIRKVWGGCASTWVWLD